MLRPSEAVWFVILGYIDQIDMLLCLAEPKKGKASFGWRPIVESLFRRTQWRSGAEDCRPGDCTARDTIKEITDVADKTLWCLWIMRGDLWTTQDTKKLMNPHLGCLGEDMWCWKTWNTSALWWLHNNNYIGHQEAKSYCTTNCLFTESSTSGQFHHGK